MPIMNRYNYYQAFGVCACGIGPPPFFNPVGYLPSNQRGHCSSKCVKTIFPYLVKPYLGYPDLELQGCLFGAGDVLFS